MKYREFEIKDELIQLEYIRFRTGLQEMKPEPWTDILELPLELFYYFMVTASIKAGWINPVEEENDYGEHTVWSWTEHGIDYIENLKKNRETEEYMKECGQKVFDRWRGVEHIDPN